MLEDLRSLLNYIGRRADAQRQREAMIDLLIWTMYADRRLTLPENEHVDRLTEEMEWSSPTAASQYLNVAIARVRDVLDDEDAATVLIGSIRDRLGTSEMRREAYEACRGLAKADGEVADEELAFLHTIREQFDLENRE